LEEHTLTQKYETTKWKKNCRYRQME